MELDRHEVCHCGGLIRWPGSSVLSPDMWTTALRLLHSDKLRGAKLNHNVHTVHPRLIGRVFAMCVCVCLSSTSFF